MMKHLRRRQFLGLTGGLVAGLFAGVAPPDTIDEESQELSEIKPQELPKVPLGKTTYRVTRVGMGGAIIAHLPAKMGIQIVLEAYRAGINYFDTASQYGNGKSEMMYGTALKPVRDRVIIATKTLRRQRDLADREIEESLSRLKTDTVDILQIHAINKMDDWRVVSSAKGSLRAAEKYQKAGQVRYIGITGHSRPEVLMVALKEYPFATVLLPISAADAGLRDFVEVVEFARSKGIGVIGMKVMAAGRLLKALAPRDCLRYTLSRDVDTAIIGFSEKSHIHDAAEVASEKNPLSKEQLAALEDKARPFANPSVLWWKQE